MFSNKPPPLDKQSCALPPSEQAYLLDLARQSIRHGLQDGRPLPVDIGTLPPSLAEPHATFVTLEKKGQLRGCMGCLEAIRPLALDIAENAYAAAFRDPRFSPVREEEVDALDIHLSLLTPPEPLDFNSEADLLAQIRPGIDGLILEEGRYRGTFLPSVWKSLPEPGEFLRHLKLKAGLPERYWSPSLRVSRYRAEFIGEVDDG